MTVETIVWRLKNTLCCERRRECTKRAGTRVESERSQDEAAGTSETDHCKYTLLLVETGCVTESVLLSL